MNKTEQVEIPEIVWEYLCDTLQNYFDKTDEDITLIIPNPKKERIIKINYIPAQ